MAECAPREPFDPTILEEQQLALEVCSAFARSDPMGDLSPSALETDAVKLGTVLQPAIEGLCRRYPDKAFLRRNAIAAKEPDAYGTWMASDQQFKEGCCLEFRPGLLLALRADCFSPCAISLVRVQQTATKTAALMSLQSLPNRFNNDPSEEGRTRFTDEAFDVTSTSRKYALYVQHDVIERPLLIDDEKVIDLVRLDRTAAQAYMQHGVAGLAKLQLHRTLRQALRLVGLVSRPDHPGDS